MSWTIQIRRDLAANWTSIDPILASGEIGLETDTLKAKVGNGSTAWSGLSYWNPGGGSGAVSSVFGRTGTVVAASGDYTAAQVGADASGAAATAQSNAETFATSAVATETARAEAAEATMAALAGASFTGPVSVTESAAAGGILTVVNSHTTPSSPTVQYAAQTAADLVLGIQVTGDADERFTIDSNGQVSWGSGSAATDTTLSRIGINALQTGHLTTTAGAPGGAVLTVINTSAAPTAANMVFTAEAAADSEIGIRVAGDTAGDYRLLIDSNGKMSWGTGSAVADTTLARVSAGRLQTTSMYVTNFASAGNVLEVQNSDSTAPTAPNVQILGHNAADQDLGLGVTGDTVLRLIIDTNGKMKWGPGGSTAGDTDLYRASSGMLQTDTSLTVSGALTLGTPLAISDGGTGTATGAPQNEVLAGPATGGTGAPSFRSLTAADLPSMGYAGIFGDGSDGAATMDGSTTVAGITPTGGNTYQLTHNVYFTNLTINSGITLNVAGYVVFCAGTLTNNGTIACNGNNGAAGGTAGGSNGSGTNGGGRAGGAGTTGAGTAATTGGVWAGTGGAGGLGASGAGGSSSSGITSIATGVHWLHSPIPASLGVIGTFDASYALSLVGGSGGGGDGTVLGGGGGSGAGFIILFAWSIINNGTFTAVGGNGGTPASGNAGGGGGGSGGLIVGYSLSAWTAGTMTVTGGTGGGHTGTGVSGSNGTAGAILNVVMTNVSAAALDTTATDIQPVGPTASAGSSGLAADAKHVHPEIQPWTLGDQGFLAANFFPETGSATAVPNAGLLYLMRVNIRAAITWTNICFVVTAVGVGTSTGSYVGLYNSSGTLLSGSADIGAGSLLSTGFKQIALTTPQALSAGTFVWVAVLTNLATTQPTIMKSGTYAYALNGLLTTANFRMGTYGSGQTALPGSLTLSSVGLTNNNFMWMAAT